MSNGVANGTTGVVKWFNDAKGYGFIERDDKLADVFVHFTGIASPAKGPNWRSLTEGGKVKFDVVMGPKAKLQAVNVIPQS